MGWGIIPRAGGEHDVIHAAAHLRAEAAGFGTWHGFVRFHADTVSACIWLTRVLRMFWRVEPRTTTLVIGLIVVARFTSLAAFLLPLKVLLLAGSHGVPRYFRGLIDVDSKLSWMIAFSIAAIGLFLATRWLRDYAKKLSGIGSYGVMKKANNLQFWSNQSAVGRRHYLNVIDLFADLITAAIATAIMALINPLFVLGLAVLLAAEYGFAAFALGDGSVPTRFGQRIREDPEAFIEHLYPINFCLAFVAILVPFLFGAGGNTLLAILTFVLVRHAFKDLASAAKSTCSLIGKKRLIDALMFPTHRWLPAERKSKVDFRTLFEKQAHLRLLERALRGAFEIPHSATVQWRDSTLPGVSTFVIRFGPEGPLYQERVFSPQTAHLYKNEDVLFTHIPRKLVHAPEVYRQFDHGPFHCTLCDYGLGTPISASVWSARYAELIEQLWSIEPPRRLVKVYSKSHAFFQERLTSDLIGRLGIAVNTEEDGATLRAFDSALSDIRGVLSTLPLHISNRDLVRSNTAMRSDGGALVMSWGRWNLQPLGAYLPVVASQAELSAMLDRVRQCRADIPETLSPDHLRLATDCRALVGHIIESRYEIALRSLPPILNNPALSGKSSDRHLAVAKAA